MIYEYVRKFLVYYWLALFTIPVVLLMMFVSYNVTPLLLLTVGGYVLWRIEAIDGMTSEQYWDYRLEQIENKNKKKEVVKNSRYKVKMALAKPVKTDSDGRLTLRD